MADYGHDVTWVRAVAPGMTDIQVLAWAIRESRIVLTFDKDFGELARNVALPEGCGIILFRMPMPARAAVWVRLSRIIAAREDWPGNFSVVEPGRVRMRRFAP